MKHFHRKYLLVNISKYCTAIDQSKRFVLFCYIIILLVHSIYVNSCLKISIYIHIENLFCIPESVMVNADISTYIYIWNLFHIPESMMVNAHILTSYGDGIGVDWRGVVCAGRQWVCLRIVCSLQFFSKIIFRLRQNRYIRHGYFGERGTGKLLFQLVNFQIIRECFDKWIITRERQTDKQKLKVKLFLARINRIVCSANCNRQVTTTCLSTCLHIHYIWPFYIFHYQNIKRNCLCVFLIVCYFVSLL